MRRAAFKKTKRLYVIATEGAETEPIYFQEFHPGRDGAFRLKILGNPNHKSRPTEVVQRLIAYEKRERPGKDTEFWAVIDRDAWTEQELRSAWDLIAERKNYHLALSNPCFELWLWLHRKPNRPFYDRHDCQRALARDWPEFSKSSFEASSLIAVVPVAIHRAEEMDTALDEPWPAHQGTRVYRLVRQLTR